MKKHLFALALLTSLLVISLMLKAWGEEGPWRVVLTQKHYSIYNVSRDTMTMEDESIEPEYWSKEIALDQAEALNEAHKNRLNMIQFTHDKTLPPMSYCDSSASSQGLPCVEKAKVVLP